VPRGQVPERPLLRGAPVGPAEEQAEHRERQRDEPEVAERALDRVLERQPQDDDRDAAQRDEPRHEGVVVDRTPRRHAQPRAQVGAVRAAHRRPPREDDAPDVVPEVEQHGRLGAELGDRGEGRARVAGPQQLTHDPQVRAGRHGQELREALHHAEKDAVARSDARRHEAPP
jgi:hypothetical protein